MLATQSLPSSSLPLPATTRPAALRCHICSVPLKRADGDDVEGGFCGGCKGTESASQISRSMLPPAMHPTANPFSQLVASATQQGGVSGKVVNLLSGPKQFSAADLSMIKKVGRFMSASQLLKILNDRLQSDTGDDEACFTIEQLQQAIEAQVGATASVGRDWASLRKRLALARRDGVLMQISEQVINDFAIVFQLNAKQVLELKDIVLAAAREE